MARKNNKFTRTLSKIRPRPLSSTERRVKHLCKRLANDTSREHVWEELISLLPE